MISSFLFRIPNGFAAIVPCEISEFSPREFSSVNGNSGISCRGTVLDLLFLGGALGRRCADLLASNQCIAAVRFAGSTLSKQRHAVLSSRFSISVHRLSSLFASTFLRVMVVLVGHSRLPFDFADELNPCESSLVAPNFTAWPTLLNVPSLLRREAEPATAIRLAALKRHPEHPSGHCFHSLSPSPVRIR